MALISASREETITRFHWKIQVVGGIHLLLASLDLGLLTFALAQLVGIWQLNPVQIGTIAMSSAVGTFIGGIVFGNAADRIGRRSTMQLSLLVGALGTALGALSWDYVSLSVFQFVAGLGIGNIGSTAGAFIGEFAPARYRGRMSAFLEMFWVLGALLAALASFFILPGFGWRLAFVFGAVPFLWILVQKRFVPESPRYLISRGRHDEARQFLSKVKEEYGLNYDHLLEIPHGQANNGLWASLGELWAGPLLKRTVCTWLLWFVLVYTYFGIFVWLPTLLSANGLGIMRTIQYMLVFTGVQVPAILAVAFLVDVIGRKRVLVPALLICSVASYMFGQAVSPNEILFWGGLVSLSNIMGWGVMLGYTAELFPTRVRGTGAGAASSFGRIGSIIVPGVIVLLISSWSTGYQMVFIMFSIILLIGAISVAVLGEETKGKTLEEISG